LLEPANLREFDHGTVLIPDKYLAKAAVAPTPAGLDGSALQPEQVTSLRRRWKPATERMFSMVMPRAAACFSAPTTSLSVKT
ncbi:hypothetical protein G8O24_43740, partial [Bradyrhizobium sp. INPA01-394B]|uniref:hypothetical protein n=1 Tax=Bradyrhizobium campsiandrae TaxID=1729892 RepID=UPI00165FC312